MADQIEEVKQKTDIVALIGGYIELKKAGRNFKALCPFHGEKTPSFMVSPELQLYKCFGCQATGDVFTFLQEYEGMEFGEALKFLADRAGVKLATLSFEPKSDKEKLYEINALITKFYHYILTSHKAGKEAIDYLKKERGIDSALIETFQLGYSPNVAFAAKKFLVDKHKISYQELIKAGLVYKSERGVFDRFRGRVVFPLYDHRGNVIGFAGRILPKDSNKDLAKYINTPETPIYHKGSVLFGLNLTRSEIKRKGEAVVVEGELDLISCLQVGIDNIVALKGTAMTEDQVRLISRFAQKIILMLDADLAGDAAARRGISIASNLGLEVRVCELKKYKDPDEAAKKNPEYLKKSLKEAVGVWDFIIDSIFARNDPKSGIGASKISREIAPILAQIEDKIVQAHYAKVVSDRLSVPLEAVTAQIEESSKKREIGQGRTNDEEPQRSGETPRERREEWILTLLFQTDPERLASRKIRSLITTPLSRRILEECGKFMKARKKFDVLVFKQNLPPELLDGFSKIMLLDVSDLIDKPDQLKREIEDQIDRLGEDSRSKIRRDLTKKIKSFEAKKDKDALNTALKELSKA